MGKKLTDEQRKAKRERIEQRNDPSVPFPRDLTEASDDELGYTSAVQTSTIAHIRWENFQQQTRKGSQERAKSKIPRDNLIKKEISGHFERHPDHRKSDAIRCLIKKAESKACDMKLDETEREIWENISRLNPRTFRDIIIKK